jgi:UDP-N-acetylmuramyl pentapeptide phosphotransferase/UDP-N-acetylglucosamine-1-phosphate transferase
MILALILPVGAFAVSAVLTALVRRAAIAVDFCAHPRQDRYHRTVIALGGGIAIFWTIALFILAGLAGGYLAGAGKFAFIDHSLSDHLEGFKSQPGAVGGAGMCGTAASFGVVG